MKLTKFLAVLIALFCVVTIAEARKFRFGPEIGFGYNSAEGGAFGGYNDANLQIGARVEYFPGSFNSGLYLSSGLRLVDKHWNPHRKLLWDDIANPIEGVYYPAFSYASYIELPLIVGYKLHLSNYFGLIFEGGPWIGVGYGDICYAEYVADPQKGSPCENRNGFGPDGYRRFEVGVGARVGVEFRQHWQLRVGYDWQINTIRRGTDFRNQTFSVTAAYMF